MKYLSDTEHQDLIDFSDIADNLLGGQLFGLKNVVKSTTVLGIDVSDDSSWFLEQRKRIIERKEKHRQFHMNELRKRYGN